MDKLCAAFQIGRSGLKSYLGLVVIDGEATYLIPHLDRSVATFGVLGGAIGGAIAGGVGRSMAKKATLPYQAKFEDLSSAVQRELAFYGVTGDSPLSRICKSCVKSIKLSIWTGCKLTTDLGPIRLDINFFRTGRARSILQKYGWVPVPTSPVQNSARSIGESPATTGSNANPYKSPSLTSDRVSPRKPNDS